MSLPILCLKKREEKRIESGHVWIYSNEVDTHKTPLTSFKPGQLVRVERSDGRALGLAYLNPHTLLCARLLSRDSRLEFNQTVIEQRLQRALSLRVSLFPKPFYRLVYGESDELPGLIVDRFGDLLVVQLTTAGMENLKTPIIAALQTVIKPQAILLRNDHSMRETEGLTKYVEVADGHLPEIAELEENGVRFYMSPESGQKTGWFYDHRETRAQLPRYVAGKRVLDLFSYVGGWSIQAAVHGAREVVSIDSSQPALNLLSRNAELNQVAERVIARPGDVFEQLKNLYHVGERFDVVILDPPAFIKKRKDLTAGLLAYQRVNELAIKVLREDGFLFSASCSQHLATEQLRELLAAVAVKLQRRLQLIGFGSQGADHPIHPSIPETCYLKTLICRV